MKITRINRIDGHRVFSSFSWPAELPDFARFNLIYGWNGSGKTTLSNLLRYLEKKESILEGKVDFHIDGKLYSGSMLASSSGLPRIRVFNQDYRDDSVFATVQQQLKPIFFLGKDSVDKQKQIEELNRSKSSEEKKRDEKNSAKIRAIKALEDFCIREAKAIKDLLSSSGSNPYNNYDKSHFKATCAKLTKLDPPRSPLTEKEKTQLKQQKDGTPKETVSTITVSKVDFDQLRQNVEKLLHRTVVSEVIKELLADASIAEWVLEGIGHHTGEKHSEKCRFCSSPIPDGRIAKLQAHFNDEYNRFLVQLDTASTDIAKFQKELTDLQLPAKATLYDHLAPDYLKSAADLRKFINESNAYLTRLSEALAQKRARPFESVALTPFMAETPMPGVGSAHIEAINGLISRHNTETASFEKVVIDARKRLEESLALEALEDFKKETETIQNTEDELTKLAGTITELGNKIAALEREIVEHRRPGDELTAELRSYLGRDELRFDVLGSGYQITRNGIPALHLSEGERTAIALLYFLKCLQDKAFDIANDIVVIDDPVSSLDANSLFCAFGYIRERTKEAGQLFILTHNFPLFRQVKNWFNHMPHQRRPNIAQRPARFYMVEAGIASGKRNATLKQLDPLLHEFESEYHYLFKRVHDEASSDGANRGLEEFYSMPNIARRVLESFLSFRYPTHAGLDEQLGLVPFDPAKKARILRFLHTYSHDRKIAEPEHDLSILAETPDVLKDLLELLKAEDPKHCDEMVNLVSSRPGT